jgi:hypothetical protein
MMMTQYGPEAALIAESFSPLLRYSGTSIGYQLASIIAGGPAAISRKFRDTRTFGWRKKDSNTPSLLRSSSSRFPSRRAC